MISVILLLEECYEDQSEFISSIDRIFSDTGTPYEILVIANGTGNFFRSRLFEIQDLKDCIRAFEFGNRTTQAVCLKAILKEVRGDILVIFVKVGMFLISAMYQQRTNE